MGEGTGRGGGSSGGGAGGQGEGPARVHGARWGRAGAHLLAQLLPRPLDMLLLDLLPQRAIAAALVALAGRHLVEEGRGPLWLVEALQHEVALAEPLLHLQQLRDGRLAVDVL
eukprot:2349958-Prymnesium_polylepis.1